MYHTPCIRRGESSGVQILVTRLYEAPNPSWAYNRVLIYWLRRLQRAANPDGWPLKLHLQPQRNCYHPASRFDYALSRHFQLNRITRAALHRLSPQRTSTGQRISSRCGPVLLRATGSRSSSSRCRSPKFAASCASSPHEPATHANRVCPTTMLDPPRPAACAATEMAPPRPLKRQLSARPDHIPPLSGRPKSPHSHEGTPPSARGGGRGGRTADQSVSRTSRQPDSPRSAAAHPGARPPRRAGSRATRPSSSNSCRAARGVSSSRAPSATRAPLAPSRPARASTRSTTRLGLRHQAASNARRNKLAHAPAGPQSSRSE